MINTITFPLSIIGLNPLDEDFLKTHFRLFVCYAILVYGMFSMVFFSYYSDGDFYTFVLPIAYCSCTFLAFMNVFWLRQGRRELRILLAKLEESVHHYPNERQLALHYDGILSKNNLIKLRNSVFMFEIVGFVFAGLSPFVGYAIAGKMTTFIYPGKIWWSVDTTPKYVATYCLHASVATSVFWTYYVSQIHIAFVTVEFLRQYQKLEVALTTLLARTVEEVRGRFRELSARHVDENHFKRINYIYSEFEESERECYNRVFRENLVLCVVHHQKLHEFFKLFKIWYEKFFSLELTISTLSFSLLFYCLVEPNDYERFTSIFGLAYLLFSNLFSRCYVGEKFAEMNQKISRCVFHEINWYEQSADNKKLFVIFNSMTTKPLSFAGFGIFAASYYTFASITRVSYSYFNLIRASQ